MTKTANGDVASQCQSKSVNELASANIEDLTNLGYMALRCGGRVEEMKKCETQFCAVGGLGLSYLLQRRPGRRHLKAYFQKYDSKIIFLIRLHITEREV